MTVKAIPVQIIRTSAAHDLPSGKENGFSNLEIDLDEHRMRYELDSLEQQLREAEDTHELRIGYANKIFIMVCIWLGCVIASVVMCGFHLWGFTLSDKVLITFITSTTINVVGLFAIVAKWMFHHGGKKLEDGKSKK